MFEIATLLLFLGSTLVLLIVPGPAVLYVVTRSVDQGTRAGIVSTLGIGVGTLFHAVAAALGISTILMTSATAFQTVKLLGAGYLVFLGLRKLLLPDASEAPTRRTNGRSAWRVFGQGVVVNVLNPKTALFFFAFLPQFVDPSRGAVVLQTSVLGLLFVAIGILSDGFYAVVAGRLGAWLRDHRSFTRIQQRLTGCTYLALGVLTAVSGSDRKS